MNSFFERTLVENREVERTRPAEREVGNTVHLQYISEVAITWILNRPSNLRFHQFLHTFFIRFFFVSNQTFYLTKHFDVCSNQAIWFLSTCFCCEKTGGWWILFVAISKPTKLPLCAADFPLFLSPPILFNTFVYLSLVLLPFVNLPRLWQRVVS